MSPKVRGSFIVAGGTFALAGIYAVFTTMNGAGSLGLFLAGAAFVALGLIGRIPSSVKVGGAEVSLQGKQALEQLAQTVDDDSAPAEQREYASKVLAKSVTGTGSQRLSTAELAALNGISVASVGQRMEEWRASYPPYWRCRVPSCTGVARTSERYSPPWCGAHGERDRMVPDLRRERSNGSAT